MSHFNNPIVTGHTESDSSVQSITESGKCIPAPLCTHWGCRRPRDGIRLLLRERRSQNARALQQGECSVFPLLESIQPPQEALFGPQGAGAEFSPDLQFHCSPDKGEFPMPTLAAGTAPCKISGRFFKPELELRPLYIQEYSLLFFRVIPCFVGCLSSSLLS